MAALALLMVPGCSRDRLRPGPAELRKPAQAPSVSATVVGSAEAVFDTRNSCETIDIPDAPARAFRDYRGAVHLISSHYVARAMIGPDLNHLKHHCSVVYRSPNDTNPADFQYNNWLFSFYSDDGLKIAALVHSEYDADEVPGMCATPAEPNNCWWNTVTFASSQDGGMSFTTPHPPGNLVAALPYRYEVGNKASAYGYSGPTNIVKLNGFFYALINDWPYKLQKYGPCLIRTANVFDPASWRAWDGRDYTIRFADPYRSTVSDTGSHVCPPVFPGTADSLTQETGSGIFIVTQPAPDERFEGPPGFYIQASRNLTQWSKPTLLVSFEALRKGDGPGKWSYAYESLIDPASSDRNFSTMAHKPYLYYVRSDGNDPPYARALFRRQLQLDALGQVNGGG